MTWLWFAGEVAAVAAGILAAVVVIRRWLIRMLPDDFPAADRLYVIGRAGWICAGTALVPLTVGLIIMWRWPGTAVPDFIVAGFGFTLAGWFAGRRRLAVRDSAGRAHAPTDRD